MKIIALILTYNNRSMIDLAINKIPKELFSEIIVSDDASTDGTSEEYRKRGFKVFSNLKNLGYGGNIKNGIK